MNSAFRSALCKLALLVLVPGVILPPETLAQDHVISSQELRKDLRAAAQARRDGQDKVVRFFSSDLAKKTLHSAGLSSEQIQTAVPQLSDEEIIRLASLTDRVQSEFAAGALTNQEITYILIALGTAVVVLLIVAA